MTRLSRPPSSTRAIPRRTDIPDLSDVAASLALAYLEVEAGRRPLSQLRAVVSPALFRRVARLRRHRPAVPGAGPTPRAIRAVFAQQLGDDAFEASVIVDRGRRVTALALRLERHRGRWRVVELTAPEDGEAPSRTASVP